MAGYRELLAVEWENNAAETFRLNFPDVPLHHGDIAKLSVSEVLDRCKIQPGELDVFDGSPPCQGFSTAGKRNMKDPRNGLFREYCRLLEGLKPRAFVMENVGGMVKGKMKFMFVEILKALKACGYQVSARLMNAMYFGVPQDRERIIFIGIRNNTDLVPSHPSAISAPIPIWRAVDVPNGTRGYVTASNERHTLAFRLPVRSIDRPMATLVKSGNSRLMYGHKIEPITRLEASRFASFPDEWRWLSSWQERIGNSVPPLFMRAIAEHVGRLLAQEVAA